MRSSAGCVQPYAGHRWPGNRMLLILVLSSHRGHLQAYTCDCKLLVLWKEVCTGLQNPVKFDSYPTDRGDASQATLLGAGRLVRDNAKTQFHLAVTNPWFNPSGTRSGVERTESFPRCAMRWSSTPAPLPSHHHWSHRSQHTRPSRPALIHRILPDASSCWSCSLLLGVFCACSSVPFRAPNYSSCTAEAHGTPSFARFCG